MMGRSAEVEKYLSYLPSIVLFLGAGLFFLSCSKDPTLLSSLDTKFTDVDIVVVDDTLEATTASSFREYLPMNGLYNMLGRSGTVEARMALQFNASIVERDTVEVLSAELRLRAVKWIGDSSGTFGFTAYRILRAWSPLTTTWDTMTSPGFFEDGVPRGSYSGALAADTEFVALAIDTSMVREWLQEPTTLQNGIMLVPEANATVARGFTAFGTDSSQYLPTLTVIARNLAGTVTDTTEYSLGNDTFCGNSDSLIVDPGRMYLQAGVVFRTKIVFDPTPIPRGAIVNKANIMLWLDDSASDINRFSADTLIAAHVLTSSTDSSAFEFLGPLGQSDPSGAVVIDARRAVQLMVNGTNNGILLRASLSTEFSSLDRFVIHGPNTTAREFRPRIRVIYSIEQRRP